MYTRRSRLKKTKSKISKRSSQWDIPEEFQQALSKNKELKKAFNPSHRADKEPTCYTLPGETIHHLREARIKNAHRQYFEKEKE